MREKMDQFKLNFKEKFIQVWQFFSFYWKKFHITKVLSLVIMSTMLVLGIYFNIFARRADVRDLREELAETTVVMDVNGEEAGELYSQKGTFVELDNISVHMQDAVISTEDQRFYSHIGFDPIGIMRAGVGYILNGGEIVGGGSTITQQLAKNAYLSADQTMLRKLKELFLAIEIEKHYHKDQILEMYLNNAYFGSGVWGIQDASLRYFGKNASQLNIGESATLAGMLKAPSSYNPIADYQAAINRRNTVLMLMEETQAITPEEREIISQQDLALSNHYDGSDGYRYPQYFDAVINEAISKYGFEEDQLLNQGYTIYTHLNQNYQVELEQSVRDNSQYIERSSDGTSAQVASVAMTPETGGVNAVVGNVGEYTLRGYNRATQMRRQPGSVIKPLGVYAPALENGFEPDSILVDEEITYGEGEESYTPTNLSGTYQGEVLMYEALANSLNAPTVWLLDEIGISTGIDYVEKFGLPVTADDRHLGAISLGGMSVGSTPVEVASAYSTFANDGVRVEPHFIRQIVDAQGNVVVDHTNPDEQRVVSTNTNLDMNRMLLSVFETGTAAQNQPAGYQVAGKTGTTQNTAGPGNSNQWIAAYTPDLVITGWMGFDETSENHYLNNYASQGIGMILKDQMEQIIPYTSQTDFSVEHIAPEEERSDGSMANPLDQLGDAWDNVRRGASEVFEGANRLWDQLTP